MSKIKITDSHIKRYAYIELELIYKEFNSGVGGLNSADVDDHRKKYGANTFTENKDSFIRRLRRAFINPFNVILLVLGVISLLTDVLTTSNFSKNVTTATVIFIMILISGTIRLVQELRAMKASLQLERLIHENILVRRDGVTKEIPAEELVVGDIVMLTCGQRIPGDIRLVSCNDLFVSEASITGESNVAEKTCDNLAFMTTTVISGSGEGIVLAVGAKTLYGNFVKNETGEKNAFEKGANSIAFVLLKFIAVLIPIVFILFGLTKGNWLESFAFALSVAVGLIPEMLPMVVTACLARGSIIMSKKETIIKDINAMQGFGSMDVLCMDKTGTLTNESILLEYYMDILGNESKEVLDLAYLNSYYHSGVRNPIDNAILACKSMPGKYSYYENLVLEYKKIDEIPFDYARKYVSVLANNQLIMKGDIYRVLDRCKYVEYKGELVLIDENSRSNVALVVDEMLRDGMKVIALAKKELNKISIDVDDENDMVLMGYLAFFDAPKRSAKDSISALKRLKVVPKILTGDQKDVTINVCKRVGIPCDKVVDGLTLDKLSDYEFSSIVENTHVFVELTPGQKYRIVDVLKDNGHTVGYLGDGINDIPALGEANVGISVDTAVDAAKDSADVILLQKDLGVLEEAILEGRKTFTNMLKYIKITASSNFGNILSIVCASAFLPFLPMSAIQILLLNLLYDILCIILPWDNVDEEDTVEPKDWSGKTLGRFMLSFGPISSLFDIAAFLFLYFVLCPMLCGGLTYTNIVDVNMQIRYISLFQTGWFLESMWTQVLILHFLRTRKMPIIQSRPSMAVTCITFMGIIVFTILTFPAGVSFFGFTRLPSWYFVFLLGIVVLYSLLTALVKSFYQKKYKELI